MSLSKSLTRYLTQQQVNYDVVTHSRSCSAMQNAITSHLDSNEVAKAVVVQDPVDNYLMAVIPANRRLHLKALETIVEAPLKLASEEDLQTCFKDCDTGAIPAIGPAFNMQMIWDDQLLVNKDIYFEAGDHKTLVHVSSDDFVQLTGEATHDRISYLESSDTAGP